MSKLNDFYKAITPTAAGTVVAYAGARHIGRAINRGLFYGHIDDLQLIKGTCLHTSTFLVPTEQI
jgi:hypothetical protein